MRYLLVFFISITLFSNTFSLTLTKDKLSEYTIYTDIQWLGFQLSDYLSRLLDTYKDVKSSTEYTNGKGIFITKLPAPVCFYRNGCVKDQGFMIVADKENILIMSPSEDGLAYGVYTFLEKLGVKFLSNDFSYFPRKINVEIPNLKIYNPRFIYREVFIKEFDNPSFSLRRKLNGRLGHRINHPLKVGNKILHIIGLEDIFETDKYNCGDQIDFLLEEARLQAIDYINRFLRENNIREGFILISKYDNGNYCKNRKNIELIESSGSPATPYINFVEYIARYFKDVYPKVTFLAEAYLWSQKPPEEYSKLPDNMGIFFSTINANFSKPMFSEDNLEIAENLLGWTKYTDTIFIWHYITNFSNYLISFPDIYPVAQDIKAFSKIPQIKGIFLQGAYNTYGSDMAYLKGYVFSKLLFNPEEDTDKLIDEFITLYYGDKTGLLKAYIKELHSKVKNLSVKGLSDSIESKNLLKYFSLIRNLEENSQGIYKKHLKELELSIDMALLLQKDKVKNIEVLKKAKENLLEVAYRKHIEKYSEDGDIKEVFNLSIVPEIVKPPLETEGLVEGKDWFDFQEFSLKLCCSEIIKDEEASNKQAVSVDGNISDWAVQFNLGNLPEGKWDIYFVIKVISDKNEGVAFRYGVYPDTDDMEASLEDFSDGTYHTVYVGTFEKDDEADLWIAPPEDEEIKNIIVDRVFIIKHK